MGAVIGLSTLALLAGIPACIIMGIISLFNGNLLPAIAWFIVSYLCKTAIDLLMYFFPAPE